MKTQFLSSPKRRICIFLSVVGSLAAQPASSQGLPTAVAASLPEAPTAQVTAAASPDNRPDSPAWSSSSADLTAGLGSMAFAATTALEQTPTSTAPAGEVDAKGNPIPLNRQQPKRILGFMPNFRSVSGGAVVHPPGWKYNFTVATRQSFDYSSFLFLGVTSLTSEATNEHPALGKGVDGFWAYTWRGFLDKTDNTFQTAWLWPSALHEDTRFYALGHGNIAKRALYVLSREVVARNYSGNQTPNIANIGGKVLTQYISTYYYPPTSENFSVLATKFSYSILRDVGFNSIREFYPDIAAHYAKKRRERLMKAQQP